MVYDKGDTTIEPQLRASEVEGQIERRDKNTQALGRVSFVICVGVPAWDCVRSVAREEVWAQPRGSFSQTILLTHRKQFAVISRSDVLVIFGASQEGFAMSFAPFGHHTELAGTLHFARGRKLRVGSVNVHLSWSILDFKIFACRAYVMLTQWSIHMQ